MLDRYGRSIDYLRLSITDRCNLRCRYCMPEEGVPPLSHGDILSYEELLRVAEAAVALGVRKIRITGGEPLVRKGVTSFIARLAALPGSPEIVLTTNGFLLAPLVSKLREAGLARVNVSLDTLRPERFVAITRRQGLDQVLDGLEAATAAGLTPLKLNMVPIAGVNDDEIADFARLSLARPWQVRFIEYMPVVDDLGYPPEARVPAAQIESILAGLGNLTSIPRADVAGPARLFRYEGAVGSLGIIPAVSHHFCGECNRLRVTADGRVRPCLFSNDEVLLRQSLREGADSDRLQKLLAATVSAKPERHRIGEEDFTPGNRPMHGIGG
ncbi:MAG: GTP 3',8-cyclase MoaA [Desulfuromonas sp.]|nr:MAG: GTP 3',8-cyclase MoaA [Desulfuromonas sp.]